ncbi:hypothetical protein A3E42_06035 [Candidatus Gottesmanbacteria bacterium RIFCSPHIGHO2_12_FULL_40_13]|nr:MAG: hypothetical protein A3E42_06035 [Candidatus Gottesmanbacteria bacterium RIFCSPHIGHO2_12_FULL_40_13]
MELILTILIPVVLSLSGLPFLLKNRYFREFPGILLLAISVQLGLSLVIFPMVIWGLIFASGFVVIARIIFILSILLSAIGLYTFLRNKKFSINLKETIKLVKNPVIAVTFIFLFIYFLLFALKPVIDSDIISSYLPLGRSIIRSDSIPRLNYYDNKPFVIPPVAGPVLFSFYYALSKNITGEIFRYINLPFFFSFLIFSYYIFRKFLNKSYSLLALVVLLTTPLLEDLIFSAGLYPDFIFASLCLFSFWLMYSLANTPKATGQNRISFFICMLMGISIALAMLFKYQAIVLYVIAAAFILSQNLTGLLRSLVYLLDLSPLFLMEYFSINPYNKFPLFVELVFILLITVALFLLHKNIKPFKKSNLLNLYIFFIFSLPGFIFIVRNFLVFNGLNETSLIYNWAVSMEKTVGEEIEQGNLYSIFSIFLAPALSAYWLIPKITGLFIMIKKNRKHFLNLFIIFTWTGYWVIGMSAVTVRWLMPILPFLVLSIMVGLKHFFKKINYFTQIIFTGILFMILSSKFIFINLGSLLSGTENLRQIAGQQQSGSSVIRNGIDGFLKTIIFTLTARTESEKDILQLLILSVIFFILIKKIADLFGSAKSLKVILLTVFIIYGSVFMWVSNGNLLNFTEREADLVFDYWGQQRYLIPYLKNHSEKDDIVLSYNIQTGLSYYTNMRVFNLQYGAGLQIFYPIFNETDPEKIHLFYKKNGFRYFVLLDYQESKKHWSNLRKKTKIFDILDDKRYSTLVLSPNNKSHWKLYEINKL